MKILVVGGGGREHALVWKIARSPKVDKIYCAPGNGGITKLAECVPVKANDNEGIVNFARDNSIDLVVVAPDDPLVGGMVDALETAGIRAFGPDGRAAALEGSKAFSKELMKKYNIPTAGYEIFEDSQAAIDYLKRQEYPLFIKADGLALGKGAINCNTLDEALEAVDEIMVQKVFGASGDRIVVEEFLTGPEVSVLAFTDGKTIVPMVSAQDHKRIYDNDEGLNTGGMGTVSPVKVYTDEIAGECMEKIFVPTMKAMNAEGRKFKGVIFFGLMLTPQGPKVIEYNCRFGDPETQVVIPRLETDIIDIFNAVIDETLESVEIKWSEKAAACVVAASGGYPQKYQTGYEISGLGNAENEGAMIFHAGTRFQDGRYLTSGGRVLGVTAMGNDLETALQNAYRAIGNINFTGMHYRKDIGKKNL